MFASQQRRRLKAPNRPKTFGYGTAIPLDKNAKRRIIAKACGYNARHRRPGEHWGPLTRATMDVLRALLWSFHNSRDGRCFPSYERIADEAHCCRDTAVEAVKRLEAAGILTVETRRKWQRVRVGDDVVRLTRRSSNAYQFRDPQPDAANRPKAEIPAIGSKSENPPGTLKEASLISSANSILCVERPPVPPWSAAIISKEMRVAREAERLKRTREERARIWTKQKEKG